MSYDRHYTYIRGKPEPHRTVERDYVCRCGGALVTRWFEQEPHWRTVCSKNENHSPNSFITQSTMEREEHRLGMYQAHFERRNGMGFVKDRHDQKGHLTDAPRIRRAGRIALGEKIEGGGARALPYFIFHPFETEVAAAETIRYQMTEHLNKIAPGQDVLCPTVLPVFLPAPSLPLIASSIYKLPGSEGRPRCIGDGETIQFKMGAKNLLEVHDGRVSTRELTVDGQNFKRGATVRCPGRSYEERWSHCEKCRFNFNLDVQVGTLPYIWIISTGDQGFYNEFFTVIELMADHVARGNARNITEIPLLLRRVEGTKARPQTTDKGIELRFTDMPLLSIEIHPVWIATVDASRVKALDSAGIMGLLEAGIPEEAEEQEEEEREEPSLPWYERAEAELPDRPWVAFSVLDYVNKALLAFREEKPDECEMDAGPQFVKKWEDKVKKTLSKQIEDELDQANVLTVIHWWFWGDMITTVGRLAAMWHWASRPNPKKQNFWIDSPTFEKELLLVLDEANKMRSNIKDNEQEDVPPEQDIDDTPTMLEQMGFKEVHYQA